MGEGEGVVTGRPGTIDCMGESEGVVDGQGSGQGPVDLMQKPEGVSRHRILANEPGMQDRNC